MARCGVSCFYDDDRRSELAKLCRVFLHLPIGSTLPFRELGEIENISIGWFKCCLKTI